MVVVNNVSQSRNKFVWVKKKKRSSSSPKQDVPSSSTVLPQPNLIISPEIVPMANTNLNPLRFLRAGQVVHQGSDLRIPRVDLTAATSPPDIMRSLLWLWLSLFFRKSSGMIIRY